MKNGLLLILSLSCLSAFAQELVQEVGDVGHKPLSEISGIVKSTRYENTYWVHNDSGDSARLFAIREDGAVLYPGFVRNKRIGMKDSPDLWQGLPVFVAANQDWEDITIDGDAIYIADIGNNGNARRDLGVYVVREPNPKAITNARPIQYLPIEYPDQKQYPARQWHFDSESMFIDGGVPYFITKHRQPGKIRDWESGAKLYRLETRYTDKVNKLVQVGSNPHVAVATGADLSPDGQWLAVLCYTDIWLFQRPESGDDWLSSSGFKLPLTFKQTGQVEAIAWKNNEELLFTNEPGQLFTVEKQAIQQFPQ